MNRLYLEDRKEHMNRKMRTDKGFTIIEVVLVLAIAGLIFLTVFLALPALQKNQRDAQRKSDIGRVVSATQTYKSNHNGSFPALSTESGTEATWNGFRDAYLKSDTSFKDPTTANDYAFSPTTGDTPDTIATELGTIYFKTGVKCPASGATFTTGGNGNVAFVLKLESGGSYCQGL